MTRVRRAVAAGLVLASLSWGAAAARSEPPPDTADRVARLLADGQVADAETLASEWLAQAQGGHARQLLADATHSLGTVRVAQRRFGDAEAAFADARRHYAEAGDAAGTGRVWRDLGGLYWATGRTAEITPAYLEAARAFAAAGRTHDEAGALRSSIYGAGYATADQKRAVLHRALTLLLDHPDPGPAERYVRGALLHDIGDRLFGAGRYAEAARTYAASEAVLARDADNGRAYSLLLTSQARLHRAQGHADLALAVYARVLALQRARGYAHGLAQTLNAMAIAQAQLGRRSDAVASLQAALRVAEGLDAPWRIAVARLHLAQARLDAGDRRGARENFRRYLTHASRETLSPGYRLLEVPLLLEMGRLDDALEVATLVLSHNETTGSLRDLRARALVARAAVHLRRHAPQPARRDLDEARDVWESLRASLTPTDIVRRGFAEMMTTSFYGEYVDGLVDADDPAASLAASELARTRAFVDLLAQRRLARGLATPESSDADDLPSPAPTPPVDDRSVLAWIAEAPAVRHQPRLEHARLAAPLTVGQMQRLADAEDVVALVYWVGTTRTLLWVLAPGDIVRLHVIGAGERELTELVRRAGSPRGHAALRRLEAWLVAPAAAAVARTPRLLIVPHGPLNGLSFATLRDARERYLVERASVRYVPSLTSLEALRTGRPAPALPRQALVVGVPGARPAGHGGARLPALPGARREAVAVGAWLRQRGTRTQVLVGDVASESAIREALHGQRHHVVHVAAHGVISTRDQMASWLALAGSTPAGRDDGRLTAGEVYDLDLEADLVVLSACRAADGPVSGDGVTGLTRAFLAAGSRAVIASLWTLPDATAPALLSDFYAGWQPSADAATTDTAEALRRAQRRLLARLRAGRVSVETDAGRITLVEHPRLWGGLILVGAR